MILSDRDLTEAMRVGDLRIYPYCPEALQPASIDVHLAREYRELTYDTTVIDVANVPVGHTDLHTADSDGVIPLYPGRAILGCTVEAIALSKSLVARVEGKSSLGRLFIAVHVTAGYIDPSFSGQVTLEIVNHGPVPVLLRAGMPIGQLAVSPVTSHPEKGYDRTGRYQGQNGPTESRYTIPEYAARFMAAHA